ncbi:MAG TPA: hypothetical protein DHV48_11065 [Prolixibacteraceae bacterium]|nr:hypothetical protein [Prolixibacteraceae bacterium]
MPCFSSEQVIGWTHIIIGKEGSFASNVLIGSDNSMTKQSLLFSYPNWESASGKYNFDPI